MATAREHVVQSVCDSSVQIWSVGSGRTSNSALGKVHADMGTAPESIVRVRSAPGPSSGTTSLVRPPYAILHQIRSAPHPHSRLRTSANLVGESRRLPRGRPAMEAHVGYR